MRSFFINLNMTEFEKYIQRYLDFIHSENWIDELKSSAARTTEIFKNLTEEQSHFAYDTGKWTLKELLQHLIDAERIFVYRALRFARKDKTELPGWDEVPYADNSFANNRNLEDLIDEFETVRKSSILFFNSLNPSVLKESGIANENEISVETLGKLIVGHNLHHLSIIIERYLPKLK